MNKKIRWEIPAMLVLFAAFISVIALHSSIAYANSPNQNVNANVVVPSTCYLAVTPVTISFGSLPPGSNYATNVLVTGSDVDGNANSYLYVSGGNWIATSHFGVSNTTWNPTSMVSYAGNSLSTTPTNTLIQIPFGAGTSNVIYFGLNVPGATPAGTYTQTITLYASC